MRKIILILVFLIVILTGCNTEINNEYYSFIDSSGTKITLSKKPENVAILFSSIVEIYNNAGGKTNITVFESVERNLTTNDVILVDSGAGKVINNELLASANPDFIIGSIDISEQVKTCKMFNEVGIPSALFKVETFEEYLNVLDILTDITNKKELYIKNGLDVKENIDEIINSVTNKKETSKILFIRSGSTASSCKAKNKDSHFACKILNDLGTINIADKAPILLDGLSIEEILLNEPDYIFITIMGNIDAGKEYINELFSEQPYNSLQAVKNNKYYFLPKNLFQYKPNHKWDLAYQYMVDILYE